jgi:hypothetical protein
MGLEAIIAAGVTGLFALLQTLLHKRVKKLERHQGKALPPTPNPKDHEKTNHP